MKNIFDFIFVLRIPIDGTLYVTIYIVLRLKSKIKSKKYEIYTNFIQLLECVFRLKEKRITMGIYKSIHIVRKCKLSIALESQKREIWFIEAWTIHEAANRTDIPTNSQFSKKQSKEAAIWVISVPSPGLGPDSLIVGESAFGANNAFSISAFSGEHPHLMALSSQAERD